MSAMTARLLQTILNDMTGMIPRELLGTGKTMFLEKMTCT